MGETRVLPKWEQLLADPKALLVATASCMLGALLAAPPGLIFHIFGYLLGCLVTFALVALFRKNSVQLTALTGVVPPRWTRWLSTTLLFAGLVVALLNAWLIAVKLS